MNKVAHLIDELRAVRRGEIAFDAVTGRISSHLISSPDSAGDLLQQVESAFEQRLIEPAQFLRLKTVIVDTIGPHNSLTAPLPSNLLNSQRDQPLSGHSPVPRPGENRPVSRSNIALGTQLRDRFILDEVLGVGGMGTVYKGRDLLKVEARDRNPYVAIKVLNDEFKKRDDAFIVLQREASRQQRLAHPNIVTVYDFDRTGDTIFISMELLEGTPLDTYLKSDSRRRGGLPYLEALPLIEGMCAALTYAHEHGIVHADFKPSNCFVLQDGKIKVLDFGIARAMKRPNQLESDLTVYDGASLGAMTPAYASAEMLEKSADPDPRDDVYGLACVCYEMLSGWHPYNRVSALDARDQRLVPKRIVGLSPRQNRALARALAFDRAARTPSARDFIIELRGGGDLPKRWKWNRKTAGVAAAVVLLLVIGVAWFAARYPVYRTIADLQSGDRQAVQAAIARIATFSATDRSAALTVAKQQIIAHFQSQVQALLDTGEIDAAYAKAESMLRTGLAMYPDSTALASLRGEVAKRKERYLSELAEQYETYLAAGRLLRSREHGDIQGVMQRIQLVDPHHPLLADPRVPGAFATAAETAINAGKLDTARALLADGTRLAPRDGVLRDVGDKLATAAQQERTQRRSSELAAQIEGQLGALTGLDVLAPPVTDALLALHQIDPGHVLLDRVGAGIRPLLGKNYEVIAGIATVDEVVAFEHRYAGAFEAIGLTDAAARVRARREELTVRRDRLLAQARVLAAAPGTKTADGASIGKVINELRTLAPTDPELDAILTAAVSEQRREAQRLSAERQWDQARAALGAALALGGGSELKSLIAQDMERIAQRERDSARESAAAELEVARAAERQKITAAEAQLRAALNALSPTSTGLEALDARISALAALDPGNPLIQSTRATAAQRIATAATEAAKAGRFNDALALLGKAAVDLPGAAAIAAARSQVEALELEATKRAQDQALVAAQQAYRALIERPQPTDGRWQRDADTALAALRKVAPSEDATGAARQQLAAIYLDAADQFVNEKRFTVAAQLLDKAEQLTPKATAVQARREQLAQAAERHKTERAAEELAAKFEAAKQRFAHEIKSRQFERARKTLAELQTIGGKDAFVTREAPIMLADAYAVSARAMLQSGDIDAAWQLAQAGAAVQKDDLRFNQLLTELDAVASRRIEALLSSPGALDRAALSSLAERYRAAAADRYQSLHPIWVAKIKRRLADLASDPPAHNTYLTAVQGAFPDIPALQSIRPAEPKPALPAPSVEIASNSPAPPSTAPAATPSTGAATPPSQVPAAAVPEPSLLGSWCGDGVGLAFTATNYSFDIGGGRIIKYPVEGYQRSGNTITMTWTDKTLGAMLTEFGEFSADGQSMVQMRGKTATSAEWKSYNRRFRRCN